MKGLLLKDLYTLGKQMKLFFLFIVVFAVAPRPVSVRFCYHVCVHAAYDRPGYDERSKWDTLAAMMPYSVTELVFSKYLLGYLMTLFAALCSLAAQFVTTSSSTPLQTGRRLFRPSNCRVYRPSIPGHQSPLPV